MQNDSVSAAATFTLSFCGTCANRAHQLKRTLEENWDAIRECPDVEWVLLNFWSTDDTHDFIMERLGHAPDNFVYARLTAPRPWHLSVAKNIAHRLGRGSFLMSLDCDNLIRGAVPTLKGLIASGVKVAHLWSGVYRDGTCGRVGMAAEVFTGIGGYDEAFYPMGYQDRDILARLSASGLPVIHIPEDPAVAYGNTKAESVKLCALPGQCWSDFNQLNMEMSFANIHAGRLVANYPRQWGQGELEVYRFR